MVMTQDIFDGHDAGHRCGHVGERVFSQPFAHRIEGGIESLRSFFIAHVLPPAIPLTDASIAAFFLISRR